MSSIYNTEPQPTASVIIHTTLGELSVELFAKQTPLTCRNFLQHCLDGYYDNTIFHRLVPGFIIQGGDPTGTGNGGESIYDGGALSGDLDPWPMDERRGRNAGSSGVNFKDEIHSRLKFNRRGLLGMANESTVDSNGSQFFFTLDKADELSGKNTMFGRIAGDTIYNLAKIGEAELDEGGERPLYPIKITRIEVLVNPFDDVVKKERAVRHAEKAAPQEKKQKKRKGGKQLLSFGDDEGDGDELPIIKKAKFDTRVVMDVDDGEDDLPRKSRAKEAVKKARKEVKRHDSIADHHDEVALHTTSKTSVKDSLVPPKKERIHVKYEEPESSPEPEISKKKSLVDETNEQIQALKASMKRSVHSEPINVKKKSALEQMIPETASRGRKRRAGGNNTSENEELNTLSMLKAFQSRLDQAPAGKDVASPILNTENGEQAPKDEEGEEGGEVCDLHFIANCQSCQSWDKLEAKEDSDDEGWMSHTLSFAADKLGKDLSYRKKAEEELVVIDPREKARNLKGEKRAERDARAAGSGRAWDQIRNAQMARASASSGRGAK